MTSTGKKLRIKGPVTVITKLKFASASIFPGEFGSSFPHLDYKP